MFRPQRHKIYFNSIKQIDGAPNYGTKCRPLINSGIPCIIMIKLDATNKRLNLINVPICSLIIKMCFFALRSLY